MDPNEQDPLPGVDDDVTAVITIGPIILGGIGIMLKQWTSYKDIGDALITAGAGGGVFSAIYHSVNYVRGAYNEVGIGSFIINILPTFLTIAGRLMY